MAFSKSITDNSGVTSTYWAITTTHADYTRNVVQVSISGWLSADAYSSSLKPSARRPYYFMVPFSALPSAGASISMDEVYTATLAVINDPAKAARTPLNGATLVS